MNYTFETGLNKEGQAVIICSPAAYNQLILDCRTFVSDQLRGVPKKDRQSALKTITFLYPAIAYMATNPTYKEVVKGN